MREVASNAECCRAATLVYFEHRHERMMPLSDAANLRGWFERRGNVDIIDSAFYWTGN
jgi:hypothetical protein